MKFRHQSGTAPQALKALLVQYDLALASGWYSGRLVEPSVEAEIEAVGLHLDFPVRNGATAMVCGDVGQHDSGLDCPAFSNGRVSLPTRNGRDAYAERVDPFARHTLSRGVRVAYHHHMGAYIETPADIDALMRRTSDALG